MTTKSAAELREITNRMRAGMEPRIEGARRCCAMCIERAERYNAEVVKSADEIDTKLTILGF